MGSKKWKPHEDVPDLPKIEKSPNKENRGKTAEPKKKKTPKFVEHNDDSFGTD